MVVPDDDGVRPVDWPKPAEEEGYRPLPTDSELAAASIAVGDRIRVWYAHDGGSFEVSAHGPFCRGIKVCV